MINKHKSKKIKENSNTVRHLNNGTDHRHSKSRCDQSSPARRTIKPSFSGIWNRQHLMVKPHQAHSHAKYANIGKGWYFRFNDDNKMRYKYILSITRWYTGNKITVAQNPVYDTTFLTHARVPIFSLHDLKCGITSESFTTAFRP